MEALIAISIICNTYNHKNYIRDAIESFLMQKTDFAFEILIHDDASTDGTADIIKEYEERYPNIIKPIYQKVNQYSQKIPFGRLYQFSRAKGKYVAFCEGDDYWTDVYKLQKQYNAMELHPELDMCAHTASMVNAETKVAIGKIQPSLTNKVFSVEDVILGGGGFVATNSLICRTELLVGAWPSFREFLSLDYTLQIQGSLRGGMLYIADNMSAYRVNVKGSWTESMRNKLNLRISHEKKIFEMLNILNLETNGKYWTTIQPLMDGSLMYALSLSGEFKKLLSEEYIEIFRRQSFSKRIKIRLKAYFPWLVKIKNKIKMRNK